MEKAVSDINNHIKVQRGQALRGILYREVYPHFLYRASQPKTTRLRWWNSSSHHRSIFVIPRSEPLLYAGGSCQSHTPNCNGCDSALSPYRAARDRYMAIFFSTGIRIKRSKYAAGYSVALTPIACSTSCT